MARPRRQEASDTEAQDRRERFVRLAESRTTNAIKAIRLVSNLSNKAHYEFTDADVRKIVGALGAEVEGLRRRFSDAPSKTNQTFKL